MTGTWHHRRVYLGFLLGLMAGIAISYLAPHEPAYASATDRSAQFAIATGPVGNLVGMLDPIDGVFTLDFLTGDLRGAVLNRQAGKFMIGYYRNVSLDFNLDRKTQPRYAFVTGAAQLQGAGGVTFGSGVIYVAELTTGRLVCYAYPYQEINRPSGVIPLQIIDTFLFRKPDEKD